MKVKFKVTWRDRVEGYRIGLSHLALPYLLFSIGILLMFPLGLMIILYGKGFPVTWTAANLPLRLILFHSVMPLGFMVGFFFTVTLGSSYLFRSLTVQVFPHHMTWKQMWFTNRIRWKHVTKIVDTGEYICFCHNYPFAIVIPKVAFKGEKQANAFLTYATDRWHDATGRTHPPSVTGPCIWPPAPNPGNSVEPGAAP